MFQRRSLILLAVFGIANYSCGASGKTGADFLDIPTGARPAALGSAYSALASDAYAPTWNPAGLGFLSTPELAGQHLIYLQGVHYEFASYVHPLQNKQSIGAAVQYLGSGDIDRTDVVGQSVGDFSSHYAAYSVSYGKRLDPRLALGATAKIIHAAIDDVSATAFAIDVGSFWKATPKIRVALTIRNVGTQLTFLDDGDPLPVGFHLGGAYQHNERWLSTSEWVYRPSGPFSWHVGSEFRPVESFRIRAGLKTDTIKELSPLAAFSMGFGWSFLGQEISYAWLPFGPLGHTHFFSVHFRFQNGKLASPKENDDDDDPSLIHILKRSEDKR